MRTQLAIATAALAGIVFATPVTAAPLGTLTPSAKTTVIDTTAVEQVGRKKYRKWRRHHYGYRYYRPYRYYRHYYYGYPRYYRYYGYPYHWRYGYGYWPYHRSGFHIHIGW